MDTTAAPAGCLSGEVDLGLTLKKKRSRRGRTTKKCHTKEFDDDQQAASLAHGTEKDETKKLEELKALHTKDEKKTLEEPSAFGTTKKKRGGTDALPVCRLLTTCAYELSSLAYLISASCEQQLQIDAVRYTADWITKNIWATKEECIAKSAELRGYLTHAMERGHAVDKLEDAFSLAYEMCSEDKKYGYFFEDHARCFAPYDKAVKDARD